MDRLRAVLIRALCIAAGALALAGCDQLSDSGSSSSSGTGSSGSNSWGTTTGTNGTTTAGSSAAWSYTSAAPVYEIDGSVASVTISGLSSGQKVFLAKTNTSSSAVVSSSYSRYVTAGSGITLSTAESSSESSSAASGSAEGGYSGSVTNFIAPVDLAPSQFTRSSASPSRSALTPSASVTQLTLTKDSTTKDLYVDTDTSFKKYSQEASTLRYAGTYCNVWVVDSYYTSGAAAGDTVSSSLAVLLGEKFDAMYPMVRNVFGSESEDILLYTSSAQISEAAMSDYDNTGTYTAGGTTGDKVNIVVYDIGGDYTSSDISTSGVVGYFYAKDYYYNNTGSALADSSGYKVIDYSNAGKYFYIDSAYAVSYTDMVYSTLAHEFQHMISFGVKNMDKDLSPSTWYNEMMSMLSEDMMQSYLGLNTSDYDDSPQNRLPLFEKCYKDNGIEYRSTSSYYTLLSYSNSYAFGAWVLRQFGGVPVLAAMSSNDSVDMASVAAAVNSVDGTSYSAEDLLKLYTEACIFSDTTLGMPTFNQSRTLSSDSSLYYTTESYGYPLASINLWSLSGMFSSSFKSDYGSTTYYKYDGPELYGYNASYAIRPYGMTLVDVGTATSDTVTLTFSTSGASTEHLYLMVQ